MSTLLPVAPFASWPPLPGTEHDGPPQIRGTPTPRDRNMRPAGKPSGGLGGGVTIGQSAGAVGATGPKESDKLQRSHWAVSGREVPYDFAWSTQTARDFVAPPPVDMEQLVVQRIHGAQRLKDLRKHCFVVGSYEGDRRIAHPVSQDIGNFESKHVQAVRDLAAPPPNLRIAHVKQDVPPEQRALEASGESAALAPGQEAAAASKGLFLRHNLRKSHFTTSFGHDNEYRTTTQIAFDLKEAPHMANRKGFNNSWVPVQHSLYPTVDGADGVGAARAGTLGHGPDGRRITSLNAVYNPYVEEEQTRAEQQRRREQAWQAVMAGAGAEAAAAGAAGATAEAAGSSAGSEQGPRQGPGVARTKTSTASLTIPHRVTTAALNQSSAQKMFGSGHPASGWETTNKSAFQAPPLPTPAEREQQRVRVVRGVGVCVALGTRVPTLPCVTELSYRPPRPPSIPSPPSPPTP